MSRDNKLIALSLFLWGVGESMWYFISSLYFEQLGATPEEVGLALGFAALTVGVSFMVGGLLADRMDRKWLLLGGWVLGAFGPLLMALASEWRQALVGFTVFNLSFYVVPVIDTYVAHSAGRAPLERVFPTVFAGFWLGSIIGPQISQAMLAATDLRAVLSASTALYVVSTAVVMCISRQPAPRSAARASAHGSWIAALRPALGFFVALLFIEFAMSIGAQFVPLYLERIGWQVADVSGMISAQTAGTAILSVLIGHFAAGRRRRGLLAGQLLVFVSMALFALGARAWGGFAAAAYFMYGGFQSAKQQAVAQTARYVDEAHRGVAFAVASTVGQVALALSPAVAGLLFAADPARPFHVGLLLIPIGMALTLRLRVPRAAVEAADATVGQAVADVMR